MSQDSAIKFMNAWEDYKEFESSCESCNWAGKLAEAKFEWETDLISSLHCPKCDRKLALISNEASHDQIFNFAKAGSQTAMEHVVQCTECSTKYSAES